MNQKRCETCRYFRKFEAPSGGTIGYCSYVLANQQYDSKRHIVISDKLYSKVNTTNYCPTWLPIITRRTYDR